MRRSVLSLLAMTVVLSASLFAMSARAQEASPPAEEEVVLPPGVALDVLAQTPTELPAPPAAIVVVRLTMEPGAAIPVHPHPVPEMGIVEAGSVTLGTAEGPALQVVRGMGAADVAAATAGPGEEITAAAGDAIVVPAGNMSDTRAGDEGVTILIFDLAPLSDEAEPEATPAS